MVFMINIICEFSFILKFNIAGIQIMLYDWLKFKMSSSQKLCYMCDGTCYIVGIFPT